MIRLLIDEHLSPRLVKWLAERGIHAQHVAHLGLAGAADPDIWLYAYAHDFAVVTMNARDFLRLAAGVSLHPGLIVLRESGLTRDEQWARLSAALDRLLELNELLRQPHHRGLERGSTRSSRPPSTSMNPASGCDLVCPRRLQENAGHPAVGAAAVGRPDAGESRRLLAGR